MKRSLLGVSLFTVTLLYGLLAGIVLLAVILLGGNILYALLACILILIIKFLVAPWLTDLSMKLFYKANFKAEIPDYLKQFIEEECKKHNVKYPRIGIIDDGAPNAFTYGRTKKDARLVLTKGIFELLNEDEVKAVVCHEMGHIVHMDMLVMTAVQLVPLILYAIYELLAKSNDNNNSNDNKAAIIGWIAYVLYIICQYIILWLSRTREYYADEFSVNETKNPAALAEALVKIGFGLSTRVGSKKRNISKRNALGIFDSTAGKTLAINGTDENGNISKERIKNAMKWEMWNPWAKWFEINSTHPLISKRLQAITKLSSKYNQEPYIVFDLEKKENYVSNFIFEVFISFMPIISLLAATIVGIIMFVEKNASGFIYTGILLLITMIFAFIKFNRAHKKQYVEKNIEDLLSEVNVSHITSVPCIVKGKIIGKGNPGCIFSEDFIIKDKTGIIFLDYNQPLTIMNKIFALFKSEQYFNAEVTVKGWYRRSPVPYIEIYEYQVDGKTKKIYTYMVAKVFYSILTILSILSIIIGILITTGIIK